MPEGFDPYHIWLGILPKDQPANAYRLLGLEPFESSLETIAHAADRQMAHVRMFQAGQHAQLAFKLLNELAAARVQLLNADKKKQYDAALQPILAKQRSASALPSRSTAEDNSVLFDLAQVVRQSGGSSPSNLNSRGTGSSKIKSLKTAKIVVTVAQPESLALATDQAVDPAKSRWPLYAGLMAGVITTVALVVIVVTIVNRPSKHLPPAKASKSTQEVAIEALRAAGAKFDPPSPTIGRPPTKAVFPLNSTVRATDFKNLAILTSLESINLSGSALSDEGLRELTDMKNLRVLDLTFARDITVAEVARLQDKLPELKVLGYERPGQVATTGVANSLSNSDPQQAAIAALMGLGATIKRDSARAGNPVIRVDLISKNLTDAQFEHLLSIATLEELSLMNSQVTPTALEKLSALPALKGLNLNDIKFGLDQCPGLSKCAQLEWLSLERANNSPASFSQIREFKKLRGLNISNSEVTDAALAQLRNNPILDSLTMHHCPQISNDGLAHLHTVPRLIKVVLEQGEDPENKRYTREGVAALRKALPACVVTGEGSSSTAPSPPSPPANSLTRLQALGAVLNRTMDQQSVLGVDLTSVKQLDDALALLHDFRTLERVTLAGTALHDQQLRLLNACVGLKSLDLSGTTITDTGLSSLKSLIDLHTLRLAGTKLTDAGVRHLALFADLQILDLSGTAVTDAGIRSLKGFNKLRCLHMGGPGISSASFTTIKDLPALVALDLRGFVFSPGSLSSLTALTRLERLRLDGVRVTDPALFHFKAFKQLQALSLADTPITDAALSKLPDNLRALDLSRTAITDAGLREVAKLSKLEQLALRGTNASDAGLRHLRGAIKLQALDVHGCQAITYAGLGLCKDLTELRKLNLRGTAASATDVSLLRQRLPGVTIVDTDAPVIEISPPNDPIGVSLSEPADGPVATTHAAITANVMFRRPAPRRVLVGC